MTKFKHLFASATGIGVLAVTAAVPATALASTSGHDAARSTSKVRKHIAVLRRSKTKRDVIRSRRGSKRSRARLAALDSRLVYDGGVSSRIYLASNGDKLCLYEVSEANGYAASTCQPGTDVVSGKSLLLYMSIGAKEARFAALALDGSSAAQEVMADGSRRSLKLSNNVVVDVVRSQARVVWTGPGGHEVSSPVFGPAVL